MRAEMVQLESETHAQGGQNSVVQYDTIRVYFETAPCLMPLGIMIFSRDERARRAIRFRKVPRPFRLGLARLRGRTFQNPLDLHLRQSPRWLLLSSRDNVWLRLPFSQGL